METKKEKTEKLRILESLATCCHLENAIRQKIRKDQKPLLNLKKWEETET